MVCTVTDVLFSDLSVDNCGARCADCSVLTARCRLCGPGRWGNNCEKACLDPHCIQNTCDRDTGQCTYGCEDGWFLDGNTCKECSLNCERCINSTHCISCKDAKYGSSCERDCDFGCRKCVQKFSGPGFGGIVRSSCLVCDDDLYGPRSGCYYDCGLCIEGLCSRYNCTLGCKEGYYNHESRVCIDCFPGCETCSVMSKKEKTCETCPLGKWGKLCDKECSKTCDHIICDQSSGQCRCRDGFYVSVDGKCDKCPEDCITCSSVNNCTKCPDGRYGSVCERQCMSDCILCGSTGLSCEECKSDYFLRDSRCHKCDEGCSACWWMKIARVTDCTQCKEGYYRDKIEGRFIYKCFKCPAGCSSCNIFGDCESCFEGFNLFSRSCCPKTCHGCKNAQDCTSCIDGYYGPSCSSKCFETCLKCSNGQTCEACKPGYYSEPENGGYRCECSSEECHNKVISSNGTCETCKRPGWYVKGRGCCPCLKCKDRSCDKNGMCLLGCPSKHKFGISCNQTCSEVISGCVECVGNELSSVQCQKCNNGTYLIGNVCRGCPQNCFNNICGPDGICTAGCSHGWMGQFCDLECGRTCNFQCEQFECPECQEGYYGHRCDNKCPERCGLDHSNISVCTKRGTCMHCKPGLWGVGCDKICTAGCHGSTCDRNSGTCEEECVEGVNGKYCTQQQDTSSEFCSLTLTPFFYFYFYWY